MTQPLPPNRPPRRQRLAPARPTTSRLQTYLVGLVLLAFVLAGGGAIYAYQRVFGTIDKISSAEEVRVLPTPVGSGPPPSSLLQQPSSSLLQQPFTVLVIGVDARSDVQDGGVRSDTLMVARVNPQDASLSLLSIPRDTAVTIPGDICPQQKINAAYACGFSNPNIYPATTDPRDSGAALTADTVEEFLDISIDYTLQVDFNGFQQIVDALGGITVDVPRALLDPEYPTENNGYMRLYYPTGLQRMTGEQALRYARTRHVDNDFGRAQRQQQVIQAGIDQLQDQSWLQTIETAPGILDALGDAVRTTMPINDIGTLQGMVTFAQSLSQDRVKRLVLQPETNQDGTSTLLDSGADLRWDPAYVQRQVEALLTSPNEASVLPEATAAPTQATPTTQDDS